MAVGVCRWSWSCGEASGGVGRAARVQGGSWCCPWGAGGCQAGSGEQVGEASGVCRDNIAEGGYPDGGNEEDPPILLLVFKGAVSVACKKPPGITGTSLIWEPVVVVVVLLEGVVVMVEEEEEAEEELGGDADEVDEGTDPPGFLGCCCLRRLGRYL